LSVDPLVRLYNMSNRKGKLTDGVDSTASAAVTSSWAAISRAGLRRGVIDVVAASEAATLEGVVKAKPVADFVGQSLTRDD
jgi:hypothetical protein